MNIEIVTSAAAYDAWRPAVSELFCKAFQRPFPEDIWDLYYHRNPFGEAIVALAIDNDRLVGHHALVPQVLTRRNGEIARYLLSISLMIDPDLRSVFLKLVGASHAAALESNADFILNFPNANGAPPLRRLFEHQPILETPLLTWTPRQSEEIIVPRICASEIQPGSKEFAYPSSSQYWEWRTSVNHARAIKLNDRTVLVYKLSDDNLITVLDFESSDKAAARLDLAGLALYHGSPPLRISGYHAQLIETFSGEISAHEDYVLRFYGRKLKRDLPAIRFSLLLSDVF